MTDTALLALRETRAALGQLVEQVEQMKGMFSDSDGAIRNALADAEAALAMWHEFRASVDPNDQGCCATCGNSRAAHGETAPAAPMGVKAIAQRVRATLNSKHHSMPHVISAEFLFDILAALDFAEVRWAAADALIAELRTMEEGWRQCGCSDVGCRGRHEERDAVLDHIASILADFDRATMKGGAA